MYGKFKGMKYGVQGVCMYVCMYVWCMKGKYDDELAVWCCRAHMVLEKEGETVIFIVSLLNNKKGKFNLKNLSYFINGDFQACYLFMFKI